MVNHQLGVTVVTDKMQLAVLDAIATMKNPAYGINILAAVVNNTRENLTLEGTFDLITDLLLMDRLKANYDDPTDPKRRKIYSLVVPKEMTRYGPNHPDYPNKPQDWDEGCVLHLGGYYGSTHGGSNEMVWEYDRFRDGSDILAYHSS